MKRIRGLFLLLFTTASSFYSIAQSGPGGIGTTDGGSALELWLRADRGISLIDNKVQTWSDLSGNGRNMSQATSGIRPSYLPGDLNGRPVVDFVEASGTYLEGVNTATIFGNATNAPTSIGDIVVVFKQPATNSGYFVQFPRTSGNGSFLTATSNGGNGTPADNNNLNDVHLFIRDENGGDWEVLSTEGTAFENTSFTVGNYHAIRFGFDPTDVGANDRFWLYDIDNLIQEENTNLTIGYDGSDGDETMRLGSNGGGQLYDGEIAEMMIFSSELDEVQYIILQNYLNARYALTTSNDFYAGDLPGNDDYDFGVFGFGQTAAASVSSNNQDGLSLTANVGLDDNDYVFAGYELEKNAVIDNDIIGISGSAPSRMKRIWYIDETDANTTLTTNITFDLDNADLPDASLATASNYKLIFRSGTSGTWTEITSANSINDGANSITFNSVNLSDGYYTLATSESSTSPLGDIQQTWYSFQSGSWGDFNTWSLDGATTPVFDNDNNEVPGAGDNVVITSGRTVRMYEDDAETIIQDNTTVQSTTIRTSGRLRLLTSTGHDLGDISGAGTLSLMGSPNTGAPTAFVENLPDGDYTDFADQLLGGTIQLNTSTSGLPLILNQDLSTSGIITDPNGAVSRTMSVNMSLSTDKVILQRDLYLNRNLTVTRGELQIHRDNGETYTSVTLSDADLNISVVNNTIVSSTGSITTGTANQRHQFNTSGDFTVNGNLAFTQRVTADFTNEAADGIVDLNFLNTVIDQNLVCNGVSNFYRIEIDKGAPNIFLYLTATSTANFNLFGSANYGIDSDLVAGGTNNNALGLITGGISIGTNVQVPTINTNAGNYAVSSLATLQIDGGWVRKTAGPALVPYGTFRINSGLAEFLVQSGITLRDAGRIEINGGSVYANAIRTSIQATGDAGSYIQNGGDVILNGGSGVGSTTTGVATTNNNYYVFTLTQPDNVFRMTDGTLTINRSNYNNSTSGASEDDTRDLGGSIFINSDPANYEVTGGTVTVDMNNGVPAKITSKAPFYNLILTNSDAGAINDTNIGTTLIQPDDNGIVFIAGGQVGNDALATPTEDPDAVMIAQPLVILNDLTIGEGTDPIRFDHLGNDIRIGRNFTIEADAQLYFGDDDLLPENISGTIGSNSTPIPTTHQNTITFDGTIDGTISMSNLNITGATIPTPSNSEIENNEQVFFNVTIAKENDSKITLSASNKDVSDGGNNVTNAFRTGDDSQFRLESGTFDQGDRSVRFYGGVYNAGVLGVFEPGTTDNSALLKFRPVTFTIETEPGAEFGNFRLNCQDAIITLDNDVIIRRLQYYHGRLYIGGNNLRVDELDVALTSGNADFGSCAGCFSVEDMIITDGNASDGGLTLRITTAVNPTGGANNNLNGNAIIDALDDDDFLFPIGIGQTGLDDGTSKYTPVLLSITDVGDVGSDGEAFITVNPVNNSLATTNQSSEVLSYYWRIRTESFDTQPTIDNLQIFGKDADDPSGGTNLGTYVSGKVLDGGTYARSSETNTVSDPSSPAFEGTDYSFAFDGSGSNFVLEDANFTAGLAAAFTGSVEIYYSRVTNGYTNAVSGADDWDDPNTWSTVSHTGVAASDYPQAGDIAIIRAFATSGERKVIIGIENYSGDSGIDVQVAELILEDQNVNEASETDNRLMIAQDASVDFGVVDGDATFQVFVNPASTTDFNNTDLGAFVAKADDGARFNFYGTADGISTLPAQITEYPNVRFEGNNNAAIDRFYQFPSDVEVRDLIVDNRACFLVNRNVTVTDDFSVGSFNEGFVRFDATNGAITLDVYDDFRTRNDGDNEIFVENSASGLEHKLIVRGDIDFNSNTVTTFDLFSDLTTGDNVILEFGTDAGVDESWDNDDGIVPELYKVVMNGGSDTTTTFTLNTDLTLPGATSTFSPLEIVNGLLIFNDASLGDSDDLVIANGSDFYLPNTNNSEASSGSGGLEMRAGNLVVQGDDTGLILDGPLLLTGGDLDMSDCVNNGNNFIEYSATGNASISISNAASTLSIGSQIRRNFFSDAGVLDLEITAGSLEIGTCTEGNENRGMLEIANDGSSFIHTGGTITFFNQNGTNANAPAASLLLEPETSDLNGSTIVIDLIEANDVNFSINSEIALNDLTVQSTSGTNSEVVQLKTRNLTIDGNLLIEDDVEFRSNSLNLSLNGNFTIDDNATYTPGLNKTTFDVATGNTNQLTGSNTDAVAFYDFDKTGEGTLQLTKDISISGSTMDLSEGIFNDNGNIIDFSGQQLTNNATHTSNSAVVGGGVRMNSTTGQQVLTTSNIGVFGNLTINNDDGVSLPDSNQEFNITNNLTLSSGILDIGPALLVFGQTATVTNAAGNGSDLTDFGEDNQIQTNSSIIDFGVEKEFFISSSTDFVFPVGEGNRYTPVKVDFTAVGGNSGSTAGSLRVRPRNAVAPIMLSESQAIQDAVLQYHWLINGSGLTNFNANLVANYDDDVIGTDSEDTYRGARAIFSDPNLAVENPFPDTDGDGAVEPDPDPDDLVDDVNNTITYPISLESDFSGEYFAGDPASIPDVFNALVFDGATNNNYDEGSNYFFDANDNGVFDGGDLRQSDLSNVVGGVIEIGAGATLSLNVNNVSFSRLIIPSNGTLEVDGTNGHLLGQVSGSGTIRINSDGSTASLPAGDYISFFDCSSGGGALEYGGSGSYTILVETNTVRQLTINGSGDKEVVTNSDITICEDLIVNSGTLSLANDRVVTVQRDFILNGGNVTMGNNGTMVVEDDIDLQGGSITGNTDAEIHLHDDLNRNAATLSLIDGNAISLNFIGSGNQQITGDFSGSNAIENIVVNNTFSGLSIQLIGGAVVEVNDNLTLTDGIIFTDNADFTGTSLTINNVFEFGSSASFTGGSAASHIDGVVRKNNLAASTSFIFPTGDVGTYAPLIVNEDAIGGADWNVRYVRANPQTTLSNNLTAIGSTEVSTIEYWAVETGSPQTATISLVYGVQSDVVVPAETTVVSINDNDGSSDGMDNDDTWFDLGRGGLSSGASSSGGTITANLPSTFSTNFYTLGGQTDAALPVELLSFIGVIEDGKTNLHWETASEVNNDYFEVLHSADGVNFRSVGRVDGNGNTNERISYQYVHNVPTIGVNYYQLKQVDFDGAMELHEIIQLENNEGRLANGIEISTYPNPTSADNLNLRVVSGDNNRMIDVQIVDISGQVYFEQSYNGSQLTEDKIQPKSRMIPGIYFMTVRQGDETKRHKIIIK